jgi:hypothetical protein
MQTAAIFLIALAFAAPIVATAHCESDHEAECETECACTCHSDTMISGVVQAIGHRSQVSASTRPADDLILERLSVADVFRPPIAS